MTASRNSARADTSRSDRSTRQETAADAVVAGKRRVPWWGWTLLIAVLTVTVGTRVRLLSTPLERDEGEYAYAGQLLLDGVPPYQEAYHMKLPGIYAVYAVILGVFGETHEAIRLGHLLANALTVVTMFFLAVRLSGVIAGVVAAGSFGVLSLLPSVQGLFANAEHFVLVPGVLGVLVFVVALDSRRVLLFGVSGLLFGLAFVIKQHGIVFAAFALISLLSTGRKTVFATQRARLRPFFSTLIGVLVPYTVTCVVLLSAGVFERFWFWTVSYASHYSAFVPWSMGRINLQTRLAELFSEAPGVWLLAAAGLLAAVPLRRTRHPLVVVLFLLCSCLAVVPGLHFRPHYFVLFLPALCLLAGIGASACGEWLAVGRRRTLRLAFPMLLLVAAVGHSLAQQRQYLYGLTPEEISWHTYPGDGFPETLEAASYLIEHTQPGDRIAVIGSQPELFFYTDRRSALGYMYSYPMFEPHAYAQEMREDAVRQIRAAAPKLIVVFNYPASLGTARPADWPYMQWVQKHVHARYDLLKTFEIPVPAEVRWPGFPVHRFHVYVRKES